VNKSHYFINTLLKAPLHILPSFPQNHPPTPPPLHLIPHLIPHPPSILPLTNAPPTSSTYHHLTTLTDKKLTKHPPYNATNTPSTTSASLPARYTQAHSASTKSGTATRLDSWRYGPYHVHSIRKLSRLGRGTSRSVGLKQAAVALTSGSLPARGNLCG